MSCFLHTRGLFECLQTRPGRWWLCWSRWSNEAELWHVLYFCEVFCGCLHFESCPQGATRCTDSNAAATSRNVMDSDSLSDIASESHALSQKMMLLTLQSLSWVIGVQRTHQYFHTSWEHLHPPTSKSSTCTMLYHCYQPSTVSNASVLPGLTLLEHPSAKLKQPAGQRLEQLLPDIEAQDPQMAEVIRSETQSDRLHIIRKCLKIGKPRCPQKILGKILRLQIELLVVVNALEKAQEKPITALEWNS